MPCNLISQINLLVHPPVARPLRGFKPSPAHPGRAMEYAVVVFLHVLGATLWVGGTVGILVLNRTLKARRMEPATRRDLVRAAGRAAAPVMGGGFLLSALTGLWFYIQRAPLFAAGEGQSALLWKATFALLSAGAFGAHVLLGRREGARPAVAAVLGSLTLLAGLGLLAVGAWMRTL